LSGAAGRPVGARSVTGRTAIASGIPTSEESERSRQLGRQDVLDHDAGAPVIIGSECPIAMRPGGAALPIRPEQRFERSGPLRDRLAPIEGCRPEPRPHGVFVPERIDP
jgi:hypothetical protein